MADKEQKEQAKSDALTEKMLETRSVLISGEIDKELAERVVRQLLLLDALGEGPIKVYIDSPGGDADAGFAIYDMIRYITPKVYTIGMGLVASAAAIILLAAPAERRVGLPNANFLIHQPLSGIRGVATEIEIHAKQLEKYRVKINELISRESGQPLEKVEKDTDRDCWLDAKEAVDYGLISRIAKHKRELAEA